MYGDDNLEPNQNNHQEDLQLIESALINTESVRRKITRLGKLFRKKREPILDDTFAILLSDLETPAGDMVMAFADDTTEAILSQNTPTLQRIFLLASCANAAISIYGNERGKLTTEPLNGFSTFENRWNISYNGRI